ncbi:MAG: ABC transporter substrate-binding protein [Firmicutes bacterium]|nr:ABC transporter substrate-binding protein [Bacillota bacterium]
MSKKTFGVLALILLLAIGLVGLPALAAEPIKIGTVLPTTGPIATFGQSTLNGIKMAIEEINAAGGVLGRRIELVNEDTKSDATETRNAVAKLINRDNVLAIIGEVASTNTLAGAPVAQSQGVPMVTPGSTNEKVTEVGDYIFRTCFVDPYQGKIVASYAARSMKAKRAALLTALSSDYSVGLANVFKAEFTRLGGKIVSEQSYSEGDQDFSAQLTKLRSIKPDVLYIPGYYTEIALIARQARQLGVKIQILGSEGTESPKLFELGGDAVEGILFSTHYSAEVKNPIAQRFLKNFKEKYGQDPEALSALGYDAALVVADAVKRAGKVDRKALRDALAKTRNVKVVTGVITLDARRNPIKSVVILRVEKGQKYKLVEQINP